MSEVCTYGEFGFTYGDGHYGICELGNLRSCAPTGPAANPETTTEPFNPDCETCPPQVPESGDPRDRLVVTDCPEEGDC